MVSTTLNMHVAVRAQITAAAVKLHISRRELIVRLLMKIMRDVEISDHRYSTVTYQDDDVKENWKNFHIRFKENENEYFGDLRKLCKFSVSCLVAMAVKKYLNMTINESDNKFVDNYPIFIGYDLHGEEIEGIISCTFFWGLPMEHLKTIVT